MAVMLKDRWELVTVVSWESGLWGQELINLKVVMDFGPKVKTGKAVVLGNLGNLLRSGILN